MRNIRNLVNQCVPLPFHDIESPNLAGRYYMSQEVTSTIGCYGNYCNHGNRMSY